MKSRLKKSSVSLVAIFLMVILMVLPTGYEDAVIYQGTDKVKAKVLSTDESTVKSSGLADSRAAPTATTGQHRSGGGARRGDYPRRRLHHRHRSQGRTTGRRGGLRGRHEGYFCYPLVNFLHRALPAGRRDHPHPRTPPSVEQLHRDKRRDRKSVV